MFASGFSKTAAVRVIKELGKGGEGIAHLVDHPRYGRVVRKTFNITGKLYSKPLFAKKLEILKKVKSPYLPKFYGQEGDKPITYHEYVPIGKGFGSKKERERVIRRLNRQIKKTTGVTVKDLYRSNLVRDRSGNLKAIDFLIAGPLGKTSRRGQMRAAGKWAYSKAKKSGMPEARAKTIKRSVVAQIRKLFDAPHRSRQEILRNANLSVKERNQLIEKATNYV